VDVVSEPKRDGYSSPGVDRSDSVGEFSNLRFGVGVWAVQESILVTWGYYTTVGGLVFLLRVDWMRCVVLVEVKSTKEAMLQAKRECD